MIEIYTVPDCEFCDEAKQILKEWEIEYKEYNLKAKENREARAYYRELGVKTAPVIVNGDEWILVEYDRESLISLLEN